MKACIAVGEAWINIANNSIDLFSTLRNTNTMADDIAERVKSILLAIKNANDACASFRLADIQVTVAGAGFDKLVMIIMIG